MHILLFQRFDCRTAQLLLRDQSVAAAWVTPIDCVLHVTCEKLKRAQYCANISCTRELKATAPILGCSRWPVIDPPWPTFPGTFLSYLHCPLVSQFNSILSHIRYFIYIYIFLLSIAIAIAAGPTFSFVSLAFLYSSPIYRYIYI